MAQFPIVYVAGAGLNPTGANIRLPHFLSSHSKVEILGSAILPGGQMSSGMLACQTGGLRTRHAGKLGDDAAAKMQRISWRGLGLSRTCWKRDAQLELRASCGAITLRIYY
jgi:hypothetical protein